ncbi:MAG: right-handed parallel beta-helix repeat-containing protein [Treponema sp.]|nr:right-handed parallel beta-helix repeat-containing protein [Treponema sp.]
MPSIPELVYAALLYKDGEIPANPGSKDFVQGTATEDGKLIFSFQRPDDTSGKFTLEIFAFVKTEGESEDDTMQFSREAALLSGIKDKCTIKDDKINVDEPIALSVNGSSELKGTVSLKIKVPAGCSLYKSETDENGATIAESDARFTITGDLPDFTVTQAGEGISAGAYQVTFTVKKDDEIVHIFSEYINVFPGMCTDTWSGLEKDAAKEITQSMISSTVYVRGTGGWYETSTYNETAVASDSNSGSFLSPFASIQKAVDKIIAINDGTSEYTIYVDGKFTQSEKAIMATFSALKKELTLTIKALSNEATLDGGARFDENGNVKEGEEGSEKRIISALCGNGFKLTLENLVIMGANASALYGGGIYFNSVGGMLTMKSCAIRGNAVAMGGGVFIANGSFTMEDGAISGNTATRGSGVYISPAGTFEMSGTAKIAEDNDVYFEGNDTTISVASDLTAASPVATITLADSAYAAGTQVLSVASGTMTQDICDKFAVTPQDDGTEWKIAPDGANGVLKAVINVYVRGSGEGWYTDNGHGDIAGNDDNSGDRLHPFATIQKAVAAVKNLNDGETECTIYVDGTVTQETASSSAMVNLENLAQNLTLTIKSLSENKRATLDANNLTTVVNVLKSNIDLAIENLILCNGKDSDYGLYLSGYGVTATFVLSGCEISGNRKGGIYIRNTGTFAIENCEIINNSGRGVGLESCPSGTITGSKIKNNTNSSAAGLYVSNTEITIKDCEISGNTSTSSISYGGGIDLFNGFFNGGSGFSFIMEDCVVSGNSANEGGGIYLNSGFSLTMKGSKCKISENVTTGTSSNGGGVGFNGGTFIMEDGEISGNNATRYGGGVYVGGGEFIMNGGKITGNTATEKGGGVYEKSSDTFTKNGGEISGNSPDDVYP